MSKHDRIDFFNMLVTSTFNEWYEDNIDNGERSCLQLIPYYPFIRYLYGVANEYADFSNVVEKFYCEFSETGKKVSVTFKFIDDDFVDSDIYKDLYKTFKSCHHGKLKSSIDVPDGDKKVKLQWTKG